MSSLVDTELRRARWRRYRNGLQLGTPDDGEFAKGGLARHVDELSVRFLVLPFDPEASVIYFDEAFWAWWKLEREAPFPRSVSWGHSWHPTGNCAVRHDESKRDPWAWDTYCALYRSGALEFGLGQAAMYDLRGTSVFRLIEIVGRIWAAVTLYGETLDRVELEGPWECALAMRATEGGYLPQLPCCRRGVRAGRSFSSNAWYRYVPTLRRGLQQERPPDT